MRQKSQAMRRRAWWLIFLLHGFLHGAEDGRQCTFPENPPGEVNKAVEFRLRCEDTSGLVVRWEFGSGEGDTAVTTGPETAFTYSRPGIFTVFARIPGESPLSVRQTIIHPVKTGLPARTAPLLHDTARGRLWVVNADNNSVTAVDVASRQRLFEKTVGRNPRSLSQDAQGNIWVANQGDATLSVLDGQTGTLIRTVNLPRASLPFGIVHDPAFRFAYVTLQATGKLLRLDMKDLSRRDELPVCPTPRAMAMTQDGTRLLVTRFISGQDRGEVVEIDLAAFQVANTIGLAHDPGPDNAVNGRGLPNALSSIVIAPDGRQAYVTSTKANIRRGLARDGLALDFQSTVRSIVSVLDLGGHREILERRRDFDNSSLPSAMVFTRLGEFAFPALAGINEVRLILAEGLGDYGVATRRDAFAGNASELFPDGLVLDGKDSVLFVHYFLSRQIGFYDVSRMKSGFPSARIALVTTVEKDSLAPEILLGKQVFHNAGDERMSKEGYVSCASCHFDGGYDGLVWDFTDRGEGLRKTTFLKGRSGMGHGPVHWSANFDEIQDFENDIRGPFAGTGFMTSEDFASGTRSHPLGDKKAGLAPELDALASYVTSLARVNASPFRNPDGTFTQAAQKGKEIFNRAEVGCARCHIPPRFTDSELRPQTFATGIQAEPGGFLVHDVGTLKASSGKRLKDTLQGLDTPTLLGIWETPPYLHDGSAPTLMDVIAARNPGDRHGTTSHLDETEKNQLVAFLMQLDDSESEGSISLRRHADGFEDEILVTSSPFSRSIFLLLPSGMKNAQVSIWDLQGRNLVTLDSKSRLESYQSARGVWLEWKGRSGRGIDSPGGIYMAQVRVNGRARFQKFLLPP